MCEFFVKADPIKYEQRSRSVRIHGVLTSLRLENMVWDILAEMAEQEGRTTNALISMFHDEILAGEAVAQGVRASTREEWAQEARKLQLQGKEEQAQAIRDTFLQHKPVPWTPWSRALVEELLPKALDPKNPSAKPRQALFDYAMQLLEGSPMSFNTEHHPGVCAEPPAAAQAFVFNHSMLRVKDPAVALDFYTRIMGLRVLRKLVFAELKFSLYFLAHVPAVNDIPQDAGERTAWTFSQRGVLELTHNWGTEADSDFSHAPKCG
ncbi:hypothetical protein B566_EDAN018524 [Ephemera danica]|nr:hypothetical protein B566_EDAN018524 [Ephemera danica]